MIDIKYYKADNRNEWIANQFETIMITGDKLLEDKFVPRQDASIVFHFKTLPYIVEPINLQLNPFFIVPVVRKANMIKIEGQMDTFIATCRPSVLSKVFGINLSPSPNLSIDLPYTTFHPLWEQLKEYQTTEQRITCFTEFVNSKVAGTYIPDDIDKIYNSVVVNSIHTPLSEILKSSELSISTIQRKFICRVGLSAKTLARIVRINYLWDKINNEKAIDFQNLIFYGNYFDQAHFINDFKLFTGERPSHFFKRNLEVCKLLSGQV